MLWNLKPNKLFEANHSFQLIDTLVNATQLQCAFSFQARLCSMLDFVDFTWEQVASNL